MVGTEGGKGKVVGVEQSEKLVVKEEGRLY
jgi:hypothetical protein